MKAIEILTIGLLFIGQLWPLVNQPEVELPATSDPPVGASVTAFSQVDPRDPNDPYDIQTNWIRAVDELASIGVDQVNFAVYRIVTDRGELKGGPTLSTVKAAVERANQLGLTISIMPFFETTTGWRGKYNPRGKARRNFQVGYVRLISELAEIKNVDRFTVASELNAMVADPSNLPFFDKIIRTVANSSFDGDIGFLSLIHI